MAYNTCLTNKLSTDEKMIFYNSVINNDLDLFKILLKGNGEIQEPYDIFEEVSAPGYKWTVFHYAMHYGNWEIIKYIFDYLIDLNKLDIALKMKTNDNRCPMLCLIRSNFLNTEQKKELYFKIINTFSIPIDEEVIKEAIKKNLYGEEENSNSNNPFITNELSIKDKMKFYNSAINGNLNLFKSFIYGDSKRKPYNIFEEVSAAGYNWTVFHYAMHYGKWDIIKFIIEYLTSLDKIDIALSLKTEDNRCPFLCLLKSKDITIEKKREIFSKIMVNFNLPINIEVTEELFNRNMDDLLIKNLK